MIAACFAGCSQEPERVIVLKPAVAWPDLGLSTPDTDWEGYELLTSEGTQGLFPASLAIARVTIIGAADKGPEGVAMDMEPPNDFLPWNSAFDSLRYVSDAFPMHSLDLSGDSPTSARLCSAARRLSARICLVYGVTDLSPSQSRVRGVIFDAQTGIPLARLQAQVVAPDEGSVAPEPDQVEDDLSHYDPRVLADLSFSRLVFECIRELKQRDQTGPVQPQEGWTPEGPVLPRYWPPWPEDERRN